VLLYNHNYEDVHNYLYQNYVCDFESNGFGDHVLSHNGTVCLSLHLGVYNYTSLK